MHFIQQEIGPPKMTVQHLGENSALFVVSPLPNGFGHTLGNAMRRALHSSLPGTTITAVKITGVTHEYSSLPGVKDSVLDIILNLKQIRIKKHSSESEIVTLEKKGEGPVLAKDIKGSSDIEILNPDHQITSISGKNNSLSIQLKIEKGVGYIPSRRENTEGEGWILIDAAFSPIRHTKYEVIPTRVGGMTNLDKLHLEVTTNGALTAEESVQFCAEVLVNYFNIFKAGSEELVEEDFITDFTKAGGDDTELEEEEERESYSPIEILNLSPRTLNALINGGIGSIEQLVKCTPAKLGTLRGFGKKAMDEVTDSLSKRGLSLIDE